MLCFTEFSTLCLCNLRINKLCNLHLSMTTLILYRLWLENYKQKIKSKAIRNKFEIRHHDCSLPGLKKKGINGSKGLISIRGDNKIHYSRFSEFIKKIQWRSRNYHFIRSLRTQQYVISRINFLKMYKQNNLLLADKMTKQRCLN